MRHPGEIKIDSETIKAVALCEDGRYRTIKELSDLSQLHTAIALVMRYNDTKFAEKLSAHKGDGENCLNNAIRDVCDFLVKLGYPKTAEALDGIDSNG